ncbi:MAG: DNA-binding protein [Bdellovibrio sp. ArHS]|uniref:PPC domain-containing DNA-binding protein n=1 Tax=Bdellovibrio sp. ArHS TaxID=1569284 RepID=UPI000582715C|nr:PPC domain-containing DNA-binding protein [Bdellovibrio sp. ArHS]KHD90013.1 MAG: DNA-binding protein [Bdellovibrio sp. ArHS]
MATQSHTSSVVSHCFRLRPQQDLKKELLYYCQMHHLHAATVICSVGSLSKAHIRLAGGKDVVEFQGPFEIISLNGTVSAEGIHMHISLSNFEGTVIGGHLMDGCLIHTTAEIILLENTELTFAREQDGHTGYKELVVKNK